MNEEHKKKWNACVDRINAMSNEALYRLLIHEGKCPVETEHLIGVPMGMFHCQVCGTMVVAGCAHGPLDPPFHPDKHILAKEIYEQHPEWFDND